MNAAMDMVFSAVIKPPVKLSAEQICERELACLAEAYCVEHNLPCRRHFTHEELEQSIERVREASQMQELLKVKQP